MGSVFNFNSNLTQVTIDSDNPNFKAVNNIIYNKSADASKDMNTIYFYPRALTTTIFTIDDKVTTIENSAFIGASNLKEIVIGKSVTSIGPSAFKDCSGLEKISMAPNGTGSIRVYNDAFNNCESLFDVRLERLSVVGRAIFSSCKSLKQIKLNNGIRMDNGAFYNCQSLEKIVFIGSVAFSDDNYNRFLEKTSDNLTIYVPSTTYTLVVDTFTNIQGLSPYVGAIVSYTNIDECGLIDYDNV